MANSSCPFSGYTCCKKTQLQHTRLGAPVSEHAGFWPGISAAPTCLGTLSHPLTFTDVIDTSVWELFTAPPLPDGQAPDYLE